MSEPSVTLVLVRHGETEWSKSGRHTGRTDLPLTDEGRRVAERLAQRLAAWNFSAVFSSPLRRAQDTCQVAGLHDKVQLRPELLEWDYGPYEGLTSVQIQAKEPGWTLWTHGTPGGESVASVEARVDHFLSEVRELSGTVVAFSHGHLLRVLAARWVRLAPLDGRVFTLGTASVSVLGGEHHSPVVQLWNDQSHLAAPK